MKNLLILLLVLASLASAEIKIELTVRIDFSKEMLDYGNIDEKSEECVNFFNKQVRSNDYGTTCGSAGLCKTMLDSNILFGIAESYYYGVEYYVLTGATHSLREVVEDEFSHYKKCNGFTGNDSIYSSIFKKIDSVLVPALDKYSQNKRDYTYSIVYDHEQGRIMEYSGRYLEYPEIAQDSVDTRNATASIVGQNRFCHKSVRVQNRRLMVPEELSGRPFALFDVNGHALRQGTLKNNMEIPAFPTIIKIQGFEAKLLK